jgi:hypothetical protein
MKFASGMIAALGLASTQAGPLPYTIPPDAYVDPIDQQIARTGKGIPGRPVPCGYERDGGRVIESQPTSICYKMLPEQRWRGLWMSGQESSIFCPEPAQTCNSKTPGVAYLEDEPGRPGYGSVYRVDFIGRRTMYRGNYDGVGMIDQIIVFDRAISIELIEASPITHIKNCAAAVGVWQTRDKWCFKGELPK